MERWVEFVGENEGVYMFQTPSWSGKDEVYTVLVRSSDWSVKCDCFGSNRWKKIGYAQHPDLSDPCKHEKAVLRLIERHLGPGQDEEGGTMEP